MKKILSLIALTALVCSCAPSKTVPVGDFHHMDTYKGYNRIVYDNYVVLSKDTIITPNTKVEGKPFESRNMIIKKN